LEGEDRQFKFFEEGNMRKGFLIMLAVVLVAALAAPAMAGTDINGYYRAKGYVSNVKTGAVTGKDIPSQAFVEQRLRMMFSKAEENVKVVMFLEQDIAQWGDNNYAIGRNVGGALGADSINLELKNAYLWFKLPNTSLDFTVGLQSQSGSYGGLFALGADMAGIFVKGKMDPVTYRLGWAKWFEQATAKADDATFYLAEAKFSPAKDVKLGANLYFIQDDRNKTAATPSKTRIYMPGFDASFAAGPATVSGWFFYQNGKQDYLAAGSTDYDIKGFAAELRGDMNVGPGKAFLMGTYVSGGDNTVKEWKSVKVGSDFAAGMALYARPDLQILVANGDDINTSVGLVATGNGGRGYTLFAAGYSQKINDKLTGKVGAGYARANKMLVDSSSGADASFKKKAMGTEVNANVNYNIMKGLDFGLYGAYAWLGDFFKPSATTDADNAYDLHARLNYAF